MIEACKAFQILGGNAASTGFHNKTSGEYSQASGMNNIILGPGTLTLIPKDIDIEIKEDKVERWDWLDDVDE